MRRIWLSSTHGLPCLLPVGGKRQGNSGYRSTWFLQLCRTTRRRSDQPWRNGKECEDRKERNEAWIQEEAWISVDWMNEWMDGWMDLDMMNEWNAWMNEYGMNEWIWMNVRMNMDEWTNGYECMYEWMWMYVRMNEWMYVRTKEWLKEYEWMYARMNDWRNMNECMHEWMYVRMNECMNMNEWMNEWIWMNEQMNMNERTNEYMDEWTNEYECVHEWMWMCVRMNEWMDVWIWIMHTAIHIILHHTHCDAYHTVSYTLRLISYCIIHTATHIILHLCRHSHRGAVQGISADKASLQVHIMITPWYTMTYHDIPWTLAMYHGTLLYAMSIS